MSQSLSYWENKQFFDQVDATIVGSGIVGLTCALQLRSLYPQAKILVLERGVLPQGASTKNAGFACFGSLSELIADCNAIGEQETLDLVTRRWLGLQQLRQLVGDTEMDYKQFGGYELFFESDRGLFDRCRSQLDQINQLLEPLFDQQVFSLVDNTFGFRQVLPGVVLNPFEGQIDTGKLMMNLIDQCQQKGIRILTGVSVLDFSQQRESVDVETSFVDFKTKELFIATNGFAKQLIDLPVKPARAQVLITEELED